MRDPPSWTVFPLLPGLLGASLVAVASGAAAHEAGGAAGAVASRALPTWTLWAAGGLVVVLSFALVGLFLTRETAIRPEAGEPVAVGDLTGLPQGLVGALRILGLVLLLATVAAALVPWDPGTGVPRLVWLGLWATLPVIAYTVGNVWAVVSPFRALAGLAERLRGSGPPFAYPGWASAWPSLVLLVGLACLEALRPEAVTLGRAAIVYTTFTLAGMATFGSRTWLREAEVFDRAFAWWASLAPGRLTEGGWRWGPPGGDLHRRRAGSAADASFVVGLLFATNLDGLLATGLGRGLKQALGGLGTLGAVLVLAALGILAFLGVFWGAAELIRRATGTVASLAEVGAVFAVTLVPIGVGYHLAHNLAYLLEGLPLLVDALADPLGLTAGTATAWSILSGRPVLLGGVQMGLVVVGHVAAVAVAHRRSFTAFPSKVQAVKSELPLTGAMVLYTLASLWLITAGHGGVPG